MKNDWILKKIKSLLKEKEIKMENFSKEIGISVGEFSKILSGERANYFKHLPQIALSLDVDFHDLVAPPASWRQRHLR